MSVQPRSSHRRQQPTLRVALVVAFSAMTAVAFGLIVYFAGTSVTWFATSPTSDPLFGELNECLLRQLPASRMGYAVSPDGTAGAAFNASGVVICRVNADETDAEHHWIALSAISGAAWDFDGTLWVSTSGSKAQPPALWRVQPRGAPVLAGEAAIVSLSGHKDGVVVLDANGKLMSLSSDGSALGYAELPRPTPEDVQLSVDASGETVSVVAGGGVWLYAARDLKPLRAESPCQVQYLWWLSQPARALVSCGPDESWAITLDATTGAKEEAPRHARERSVLVPKKAAWVRNCDGLPCEAREPY